MQESSLGTLQALREHPWISGLGIGLATLAFATGKPPSADAKIISATSSITPIPGAPPGPQPEAPGDKPVVVAPAHTTKEPGGITYEVTVPNLHGTASFRFTNISRLATLKTVGRQKASQREALAASWSLGGNNTPAAENVSFMLSPKARLGSKICATMVIDEMDANASWARDDTYTDLECAVVSQPVSAARLIRKANKGFFNIYRNLSTVALNTQSLFVTKNKLVNTSTCTAGANTKKVVDRQPKLVLTFCDGQTSPMPRSELVISNGPAAAHVNYQPLADQLGNIVAGSIGFIPSEYSSISSAKVTKSSTKNIIDVIYTDSAMTSVVGDGQELREVRITDNVKKGTSTISTHKKKVAS